MKKYIRFILCLYMFLGMFLSVQVYAQMMDVSSIVQATTLYDTQQKSVNSDEKVLEQLSASILKSVFVEPIVMGQYYNFVDDDSLFQSDNGIQQEILVKILSESLAKQDILKLKEQFLQQQQVVGDSRFTEPGRTDFY